MDLVYAEYQEAEEKAIAALSTKMKAPGFRQGKVPVALARGMVDPNKVFDRIVGEVVAPEVFKTLEANKKAPYTFGGVTERKGNLGGELSLVAKVYLYPKVKVGDYKTLSLKVKKKQGDALDKLDDNGKMDLLLEELIAQSKIDEVDEGTYNYAVQETAYEAAYAAGGFPAEEEIAKKFMEEVTKLAKKRVSVHFILMELAKQLKVEPKEVLDEIRKANLKK